MRFFFTFLFCFLLHLVAAQSRFQVITLNSDNGLAQNSVYDVLQDRYGYLWIGTADGINRWDGLSFDHYFHLPEDTNSIYGTNVFSFYEDSTGRLWVGHNKGLSYFNPYKNRFQNVLKATQSTMILGAFKGELYVVLDGLGVKALPLDYPEKNAKMVYQFPQNTRGVNQFMHVVRHNNKAWTALDDMGNLLYANLASKQFKVVKTGDRGCKPLAIVNDELLVSIGNRLFGLSEHLGKVEWKPRLKAPNLINLTQGKLYNGQLWLGGIGGYLLVNPTTWKVEESLLHLESNTRLQLDFVYNFYIDRCNNLYICTNTQGLHIISPSRNRFRTYATPWPEYNMVKSIIKTKDGKLITGQYGSHLTIYSSYTKPIQVDFPKATGEKVVYGLYNWNAEEVLVVLPAELRWYNHVKGYTRKTMLIGPVNNNQYPEFISWQGKLCVNLNLGVHGAIVAFDEGEKLDTIAFFPNEILAAWHPLPNDQLLVGTLEELRVYDLKTKKVLSTQKVWAKTIQKLSTGNLAICTTTGLILANAEGKPYKTYTTLDGLPDNFIYSALEDDEKQLWMSHNKGITRINLNTGEILNYNKTDGLQSNEFNTGAFHKAFDGLFYFGGINGVNEINPQKLYVDQQAPQVVIRQILVNDEPLSSDTAFDQIKRLTLQHYQNTLAFDLAALNLSIPERNQYAYMLKGYDKSWVMADTRHYLRYTNLPPGDYILLVKAANADGVWGMERSLAISITPPFWKTRWFYMLEIVLVWVVLAISFQTYRYRQKRKAEQEMETLKKLEAERLRISRDLHDNVGAQLSFLITNLEWLADHPTTTNPEWHTRLQKLSDTGREAMLTLRETIWAISSSELTFENLADRFKQYALRMLHFDQGIKVHFHEELSGEKHLSPAIALHLFRICQEAFHNALKHSGGSTIHINFTATETETSISIQDNGRGFDTQNSQRPNHYGLQNMQIRAQEAGLGFELVSGQEGTKVKVVMPS
jgi:signal transduction histidine kinase/ligand-binding sensor domain-containing protein